MTIVSIYGLDKKKELQTYSIHENTKLLSVFVKQEHLFVTGMHNVNTRQYSMLVEFAVFREGRHFNVDGFNFLGTVVLGFGNDIYHVFYREIKKNTEDT